MKRRLRISAVAIALALLATTPATFADQTTRTLKATFEEQAYTEGCTSPVGLCARGQMKGGIHGPFELIVTGTMPTGDPDVIVLQTSSVVHTNKGDMTFSGLTLLNTVTGRFSSLDTLVSGTGKWAGASGTLHSSGVFTVESGGTGEITVVLDK